MKSSRIIIFLILVITFSMAGCSKDSGYNIDSFSGNIVGEDVNHRKIELEGFKGTYKFEYEVEEAQKLNISFNAGKDELSLKIKNGDEKEIFEGSVENDAFETSIEGDFKKGKYQFEIKSKNLKKAVIEYEFLRKKTETSDIKSTEEIEAETSETTNKESFKFDELEKIHVRAKYESKDKVAYFTQKLDLNHMSQFDEEVKIIEARDKKGDLVWTRSFNGGRVAQMDSISSLIPGKNNNIYIQVKGILYCIDAQTGDFKWKTKEAVGNINKPLYHNDRIYTSQSYDANLICLNANTGEVIWEYKEDDDSISIYEIILEEDKIVAYAEIYDIDHQDTIYKSYFDKSGNMIERQIKELSSYEEKVMSWDSTEASKTLKPSSKYSSNNIRDGKNSTAWVEGAKGHGKGQWVKLNSKEEKDISFVKSSLGYHKSNKTFEENSCPISYRLEFSDGTYIERKNVEDELFLEDEIVLSSKKKTNFVKLTILDVREGTKYQDTCITEIKVR